MPYLPRSQNDDDFVARAMKQGATAEEAEALLDDHYADMDQDMANEEIEQ